LIVRARAEYMQIGNPNFTWFGTTASKSRRNVLGLRRAGHGDFVINSGGALTHMRAQALAASLGPRSHDLPKLPSAAHQIEAATP
jgi:hypothetical protein